jgi:hypothetical protein
MSAFSLSTLDRRELNSISALTAEIESAAIHKSLLPLSDHSRSLAAFELASQNAILGGFGQQVLKSRAGAINPPKGTLAESDWDIYSGDGGGVKRRFLNTDFDVLRSVAEKVAPIAAIQNVRVAQIKPFCRVSYNDDDVGFKVFLKDKDAVPTPAQKKEMRRMENFFLEAGHTDFEGADERFDALENVVVKITRELMTIDQYALSLRRDNAGRLLDFWVLDGATIKKVKPSQGYQGDKSIKFVQEIKGKIVEQFTAGELYFGFMNARADYRKADFGYSYIEMCIDIITSWLFAMAYNREIFNSGAQPKGFFTFEGAEIDQPDLEELQRQWVAMFRGVKGMWRTPFLQHGAKWNPINQSNKDMEYNEYLQVLSSWICAIHGIDAAELGMQFNRSQPVMFEKSKSAEINYSLDRGLKELLTAHEEWMNDLADEEPLWKEFYVAFTGMEKKNQLACLEIDEKQCATYMTLNEKRAEKDLPPVPHGDIVLNPTWVQYVQQAEATAQMSSLGAPQPAGEPGGSADAAAAGGAPDAETGAAGESQTWEISADDLTPEKKGEDVKKSFELLLKAEPGTKGLPVGTVHRFKDGFFYSKQANGEWVRISKDKEKAEAYAKKQAAGRGEGVDGKKTSGTPEVKAGDQVRIKPTDKSKLAAGGRGMVARVQEIGKDFVRIIDEGGRAYRVNTMALEFAKSFQEMPAVPRRHVIRLEF